MHTRRNRGDNGRRLHGRNRYRWDLSSFYRGWLLYFLWHRLIPGRKLFALTGTFFFHFFKVVKRWSGRFHLFNRRRFNDRRGNNRLRLILSLLRFILLRLRLSVLRLLVLRLLWLLVLWLLVLRLRVLRLLILRLLVLRLLILRLLILRLCVLRLLVLWLLILRLRVLRLLVLWLFILRLRVYRFRLIRRLPLLLRRGGIRLWFCIDWRGWRGGFRMPFNRWRLKMGIRHRRGWWGHRINRGSKGLCCGGRRGSGGKRLSHRVAIEQRIVLVIVGGQRTVAGEQHIIRVGGHATSAVSHFLVVHPFAGEQGRIGLAS